MGMYDIFVAALRCATCGRTSPSDYTTNMQTKLRDAPDLSSFKVGDTLAINHATMVDSGYYAVQPASEPVHIAQMWSCPYCHHYPNWAEIVVRDSRIERIEAVPLDLPTLDRVHYLDDDALGSIEMLAGRNLRDQSKADAVALLRSLLSGAT